MIPPTLFMENTYTIELTTQNLYFHEKASIYSIETDGKYIYTAGGDKEINVWSYEDRTINNIVKNWQHNDIKKQTLDYNSLENKTAKENSYNVSTLDFKEEKPPVLAGNVENNEYVNKDDSVLKCKEDRYEIHKNSIYKNINEDNTKYFYRTAIDTSISIKYIKTYSKKHKRAVNCIRYNHDNNLFASCSDGGEVVVWNQNESVYVKYADCNDAYDLAWNGNFLFVGLSNGKISIYEIKQTKPTDLKNQEDKFLSEQLSQKENQDSNTLQKDENHGTSLTKEDTKTPLNGQIESLESNTDKKNRKKIKITVKLDADETNISIKLIQTLKCHADIIQGIFYNNQWNVLASLGKDSCLKSYYFNTKKLTLIDKLTKVESKNMSIVDDSGELLFRRSTFSKCGTFLYLVSCVEKTENFVYILHYPFRSTDIYGKIGPFETPATKYLSHDIFDVVICRKHIYFVVNHEIKFSLHNTSFYSATDAVILNNTIFISALDGFLCTLKIEVNSKDTKGFN